MDQNLTIYGTPATFNETLYDNPWLCTLSTCPIDYSSIDYVPSLAGNAFYLGLFSLCLLVQSILGIYYRTWPFLIAWIFGLALEIAGYVSRIQMHNNIFTFNPFLIYLITLTIAPAFLTAGIYLCFSRILIVYGEHLARFRPRTYTIIFITSDFFALVVVATGGAITDTADDGSSLQQTGVNIMIAGLACQVFSLTIFIMLCLEFAWRVKRAGASSAGVLKMMHCSRFLFHAFILAMMSAIVTIYIRSCFRVAELQGGFSGKLANNEVTFMLLEGAMVSIAVLALTIMHPGIVFKEFWKLYIARGKLQSQRSFDGVTESIAVDGKGGDR